MRIITEKIYKEINNNIYDSSEIDWWGKNSSFNLIESVLNPVRVEYFRNVLSRLELDSSYKEALEIGCGGGILTEEIAKMGFQTTGLDPSGKSLMDAKEHSNKYGLSIEYIQGHGENLPFDSNFFSIVFCCDVLEHVRDLQRVISEISRILKSGGIFLYDTINRTLLSKLVVIKIMQDWKCFAVLPAGLHVWKMFIRPHELKELLELNNFEWKEHRGIKTKVNNLMLLRYLYLRASGKMSYDEFSEKCRLTEGKNLNISYMGYAIKRE